MLSALCSSRPRSARSPRSLSDLDGGQLAEDLAGPYDVIARWMRPAWIGWAGW
jgi:hypothetical protein